MRAAIAILVCGVAAFAAVNAHPQRIIGGSATSIENYPSMVSMIFSNNLVTYTQNCGGVILTNRMILTAAHCTYGYLITQWRGRVGSVYANSGGDVYNFSEFVIYPMYNSETRDFDISICRTSATIVYGSTVQRVAIAAANYVLPDESPIWAAGWGVTDPESSVNSEVLNDVQVFVINQQECRNRYATVDTSIGDTLLCSGVLDDGGRDQCQGDSGGPLYHNGVVVGIMSWGRSCGDPYFPYINSRVSVYAAWITDQA